MNLDDFAFGIRPANIALFRNGHQHGVAAGGIPRMVGGHENIAAAIDGRRHAAGPHKSVAGPHAAKNASHPIAGECFPRESARFCFRSLWRVPGI